MHVAAHSKGAQEGGGCHHTGHAEAGTHAGHGLHVGGVRHRHNGASFRQVQKRSHRKAKAVEQRELRKHHVSAGHVHDTGQLLDVAHQVAVRKEHTLRRTFGTRTEYDNSGIIDMGALAEQKADKPRGYDCAKNQQSRNLYLRDFLHQVFSVEDAHLVGSHLRIIVTPTLQLFYELAARNHRRHIGFFTAVLYVIHRRGVVQVHIGLAHDPKHQVHDNAGRARRKHNTDILFMLAQLLLQKPAECHNGTHELVTGEVSTIGVVDGRAVLHVLLAGVDPRGGNGAHKLNSILPSLDRNLTDNGTNLVGRGLCRDRLTESHRHRTVRRGAVHIGAAVTIVRTPEALDIEREQHGIGPFYSLGVVQVERLHMRRLGYLTCGEHHHGLARKQGLVNLFHSLFGVAVIDADHSQTLKDSAQVPLFKVILIACNTERTRACHLKHGPVDKAMMVTHHQYRTHVGNITYIQNANLVAAKHQTQKGTNQGLRQVRNGPSKYRQRNNAKAHKVELGANAGKMHHHREQHQEQA